VSISSKYFSFVVIFFNSSKEGVNRFSLKVALEVVTGLEVEAVKFEAIEFEVIKVEKILTSAKS
jgi:hypothetical protein